MKRILSLLLLSLMLFSLPGTAFAADNTTKKLYRGDRFYFGSYEQDNNPDNGPEPIEWMVMVVDDNLALLVSRYGLDAVPYQEGYVDVTWENCQLRTWMNDTFLNTAFNEMEQAAILPITLDNSNAYNSCTMWISIKEGADTTDKVYPLSCKQAEEVFGHRKGNNVTKLRDDDHSLCQPTEYAIAQGAKTDENGNGYWWLRSPGVTTFYAAYVSPLNSEGTTHIFAEHICVRPTIIIDTDLALALQESSAGAPAAGTASIPAGRPLAVDESGISVSCDTFAEMLNNLITGQYTDYQEYPFPFTIFSDSDGGLNKDALYYLDCGNGTLFQIVGDKRATKSQDGETAKGHEIPQQFSIWGFLSDDDTDMAAFGMTANCMIFLTDPEDDSFSKSAEIMLDLTNDHFGQFVQHGVIEYKFDYYPDGYDGKPAVFFVLRNANLPD